MYIEFGTERGEGGGDATTRFACGLSLLSQYDVVCGLFTGDHHHITRKNAFGINSIPKNYIQFTMTHFSSVPDKPKLLSFSRTFLPQKSYASIWLKRQQPKLLKYKPVTNKNIRSNASSLPQLHLLARTH